MSDYDFVAELRATAEEIVKRGGDWLAIANALDALADEEESK